VEALHLWDVKHMLTHRHTRGSDTCKNALFGQQMDLCMFMHRYINVCMFMCHCVSWCLTMVSFFLEGKTSTMPTM